MPNPTNFWRVIFFFTDNEVSGGWSETLYYQYTNAQGGFSAARRLAQVRRTFLPVGFQMVYIRVDNIFGSREFLPGPAQASGVLLGTYPSTQNMPIDTRILVTIAGQTTGSVNRIFMGGVSAADVSSQEFVPTTAWQNLFANWQNAIVNAATWSTYNRLSDGVTFQVPVTAAQPIYPRGNQITAASTADLYNGAIVRFAAPPGQIQGLQGYKIVTQVLGETTFNIGGAGVVGSLTGVRGAVYNVITPAMSVIASATPTRLTNRRAGRPFGQQVGRRPNRIPLRA